jgi:hypothetical protein
MHLKTHAAVFTTHKVLTNDNEEIGIPVTHSLTHALSFCVREYISYVYQQMVFIHALLLIHMLVVMFINDGCAG